MSYGMLFSGLQGRSTTTNDWECTGTIPFAANPYRWVGPEAGIGKQHGFSTLITVEHGWVSRKEVRILLELSAYQHAYIVSSCFE